MTDDREPFRETPDLPIPEEAREAVIDALEAEWLKEAEAQIVDSPRGHCTRLADAAIAAALPHLRSLQVETQVRAGRLLGLEEAASKAEEMAEAYQRKAVEHRDLSDQTVKGQRHMRIAHAFRNKAGAAWDAAHAIRDIGKGDQ